jgi:hypothetical protein
VNRLDGSAQGNFPTRTTCRLHSLRGGSAGRMVWYWHVSKCRHWRSGWMIVGAIPKIRR